MKKYIFTAVIIVALGIAFCLQALPGEAQQPQFEAAPQKEAPAKAPPVIDGHGTGFKPPSMDLSHLANRPIPDPDK